MVPAGPGSVFCIENPPGSLFWTFLCVYSWMHRCMCGEHSCVYAWICRLEVNLDCPFLPFQDRVFCFLWKHQVGQADCHWVLGVSLSLYFQYVIYLGSIVLKKTKCNGSVSIREGNQRATGSGQALVPSDLLPPAKLHLLVPEQCQVVAKTLAHEPTGSFQTTNARQSRLFSRGVTHALTAFSKGEDLLLLCLWHFCHNLQFPDSVFNFF